MGSVTASVSTNNAQSSKLGDIKLAATTPGEYEGLELAFRRAVETVINSNNTVRAAVAAEVKTQILDVFDAAQAARKPWPFPRPVR